MAAPMDGFSETSRELEVGHLLGLRWFHLSTSPDTSRCRGLTYHHEPIDIQYVGDPDRICLPGPVTITCSCGASSTAPQWRGDRLQAFIEEHDLRRHQVPVLSGAQAGWEPSENVARCNVYGKMHSAPVDECGCGFWAFWRLGPPQVGPPYVVGVVKGYGDTIEGELGFRCSHAKIEALFLPGYSDAAALGLEARYQVPVYSRLQAMLAMHKAPPGQPELADSWYHHHHRHRCGPGGAGGGGGGTWALVNVTYGGGGYSSTGGGGTWALVNVTYGGGGYSSTGGGGGGGGNSVTGTQGAAQTAAALKAAAVPCNRCGTAACATEQLLCAACQAVRDNPPKTVPGIPDPAVAPPPLAGTDAQAQLHARREGWAALANGDTDD